MRSPLTQRMKLPREERKFVDEAVGNAVVGTESIGRGNHHTVFRRPSISFHLLEQLNSVNMLLSATVMPAYDKGS